MNKLEQLVLGLISSGRCEDVVEAVELAVLIINECAEFELSNDEGECLCSTTNNF